MYNSLAVVYREKVSLFRMRAYHQSDGVPVGSERIDGGVAYTHRLGAAGERGVAAHRGRRISRTGWRIRKRQDHAVPGADGFASARRAGQRRSHASGGRVTEKINGSE